MPRGAQRRTDYQVKGKNEHALLRPDFYVGPLESHKRPLYFLTKERTIHKEDVVISPALLRILIELTCNAGDHAWESKREGFAAGTIRVTIEGESITISNQGKPMPVEKMIGLDGVEDWIPSLMFSEMFSSSHYDDGEVRESAGTYGVGAKMANFLSKLFRVLVRDGESEFTQEWQGSLPIGPARVVKCSLDPIVSVTMMPNMEKFPDSIALHEKPGIVRKLTADLALNSRTPAVFASSEGEDKFDFGKTGIEAMKMRGATNVISLNTPSHRCWIFEASSVIQESFVNGTPTYSHGKHVDAMVKALKEQLSQLKGLKDIDRTLIMSTTSFVLSSTVENPNFDGACKDRLSSKCGDFVWDELADEFASRLPEVIARMKRTLSSNRFKGLTGSKMNSGWWPCTKRGRTTDRKRRLWIVEGLSAAKYALDYIEAQYGGREYDSVLAIRGKTLNVRDKEVEEALANEVVRQIITKIGLRPDVDYKDPKALATLSHEEVIIGSDADVDGYHIRCLVIDLVTQINPTLFDIPFPFFLIMESPVIRLEMRGVPYRFYSLQEWEEWKARNPKGWSSADVTYCKGLGSSGPNDAALDAEEGDERVLRPVIFSENGKSSLSLAFTEACVSLRKEWMLGQLSFDLEGEEGWSMPVVNMVQRDLLKYARESLTRAIPGLDGLNDSLRMGVSAVLLYSGKGGMKSDSVLGKVLDEFDYRHNVQSLYGALAGAATEYPGSNNLALFVEDGNFGSRSELGKNRAASRYTHISLRPYARHLFRDEDLPILEYKMVNGEKCEPITLLPTIPLWLVNGARGIASGWSTFIPCYNPIDVITALERLARGEELPKDGLVPWFRDFQGSVKLRTVRDSGSEEVDEDGNIWRVKKGEQAVRITGKATREKKDGKVTSIHITELPTTTSIVHYVNYLRSFIEEDLVEDNSGTNNVNITLVDGEPWSDKELGLVANRSLSNMFLLGEDGVPIHISTPEEGLVIFYQWRLKWYAKRREYETGKMKDKLDREREYHRFLSSVLAGTLQPCASGSITTRAKYVEWIAEQGYSIDTADRYRAYHTEEYLMTLEQGIGELRSSYERLLNTKDQELMLSDLRGLREALDKDEKKREEARRKDALAKKKTKKPSVKRTGRK